MDQMEYEMHQAEVPTSQTPAHPAAHPAAHSGFQGMPPQGQGGCPYFRNEQQHHQPSGLPHLHPSYPHYHHGVNSVYHSSRQSQPRSSHSRNLSLQPHHHPQQPGHGQPQHQQQQQQQQTQNPPLSLPLPHSQPQSHSHSHSHSLSHPHPHSHFDPIYPGWSSPGQNSSPAFQWPAPAPGPPPSHAVPLLSVPLQLQSILRPSGSDQFFPTGGAGSTNPNGSNSVLPGFHSNQNLPHLDSAVAPPFSFPYRHPSALHRFSVAPAIPNHHSHPSLPQAPAFPQAPNQNQTQQHYQSQPSRESLSSGAMNTDRPPVSDSSPAQPSQDTASNSMSSEPSSGAAPAPSGLPQPMNGSGEPSRQSNRGPGNTMASGQLPLPDPRPHLPSGESISPMYRQFGTLGEQRRSVIRRARAAAELPQQPAGDDYDESEEDYSPTDDDDEAYRFATQYGHGYMADENHLRQQQLLRGQMSTNKRVASKKALTSLQSVDMETLAASERTCVICYNDFGVTSPEGINEAPLRLPKCKHIFGDHCIKKWFEESDSCPYCRDKVPSEPAMPPSLQHYIRTAGEIAALTYRNSQGERVNAYVPLPASRSSQTGERRPSPSDPSTENMRRTRPRFGSARGYGAPTAPNLTNTPGSRPGPPHGAFPSMAGFPGSVGPAPAGAFQPNGPLGASGEQQMPFPGPSVFVPFTQESAVGLTGLFRARGQLQPDTGSNSSMGRGTLRRRPVTTSSSLFRYSAPPPPVDSLRSPSILRPNLSAFTSLLLDHNPQLLTHQGYPPPFLPLPNTRRGQNTSTYSTTRDGQSNADLIAEAGAQFRAEMLGPSSAPSASRPESQAVREPAQPPGPLQSPTPDLLDLERDFGYPPPQAPQNPRGAAGEPPHKRRRSGSGSEGEQ